MRFNDLDFEFVSTPSAGFDFFGNLPDGLKAKHYFDNGYGISVVRIPGSYGWENGLFEVSILKKRNNEWDLCYDTHITSDVIGHCTPEDIDRILVQVEIL